MHGQTTYVRQLKPAFAAPYSGPRSLEAARLYGYSFTATIFFGARIGDGWEAYFNPEFVQGRPLSRMQGLGGFNNGESQRTAGPELRGYRARVFVRKTWNVGGELEARSSSANQVSTRYAAHRLVITAGNYSVLDVFDTVSISRDARTQFMNWASLTYGVWDFPADARGYTWGAAAEYITPKWSVRAGRFLMPLEPNGLQLDRRFTRHYGDAFEFERPYELGTAKAVLRLLAFDNRINAGAFSDALVVPGVPDTAAVRRTQFKTGLGVGTEVTLTDDFGAYFRGGWSDGRTETYAFTDIDRSLAAGVSIKGRRWRRADDTLGMAAYVNGLSRAHRDYLAAGGQTFFLGDGRLIYGREQILEAFYSVRVARRTWATADWQHIVNPGYNRDRGPVRAYAVRVHFEF